MALPEINDIISVVQFKSRDKQVLKMGKVAPLTINSAFIVATNKVESSKTQEPTPKEEFCLFDLIDIGLKLGKAIFFCSSYEIQEVNSSSGKDFKIESSFKQTVFIRILHLWVYSYLLVSLSENVLRSPCQIVNVIRQVVYVVLIFSLMAGLYCIEFKGREINGIVTIFKQCHVLQRKFKGLGLNFATRSKIRKVIWVMAITPCLITIGRQFVVAKSAHPWYALHSRLLSRTFSLGFWVANNNSVSEGTQMLFGAVGLLVEGCTAYYWMYMQTLHFFFVLTVWFIFCKINCAVDENKFSVGQLNNVIDLHLNSTKLLREINKLIAPLTFWIVVVDVIYLCYWANFIAVDLNWKATHLTALGNFFKTGVELYMQSDVNSKAHRISEWLEEICTSSEDKLPEVNRVKLVIFSASVYNNKDGLGLRGLDFFVVTPSLVLTIVGIVLTYSLAVNQLCHSI